MTAGRNFEFRDLRKTSLGTYLKEISKIPLLTREEEQELGAVIAHHRENEKRLQLLPEAAGEAEKTIQGQLDLLDEFRRARMPRRKKADRAKDDASKIEKRVDRRIPGFKKARLGKSKTQVSRIISARSRRLEARLRSLPKRRKAAAKFRSKKLKELSSDYQESLRKMVESNLRFVVSVANKFSGCGIPLIDLINEGNIGLIEAARRFDPERKVKFISYAVWWIRQAIMQVLAEQSGSVRLPLKQAGLLYKIRGKYEELSKKHNREPTSQDLAEALDIPVKEVEEVLRVSRRALSLESPIGEGSDTPHLELMQAEDASPVDQELILSALHDEIMKLLNNLTEREREVITLRFGIGYDTPLTLENVGEVLGLSRERIRQIEKKAKKKLQRAARGRKLMDFLN